MIASVCLGFFGSIFALIGMKCTKIGGLDQTKARIVCFAGLNFVVTGRFTLYYIIASLCPYTVKKNLNKPILNVIYCIVLTGLCSLSACSLYAHRITSEFFDPMFVAQKYDVLLFNYSSGFTQFAIRLVCND